MAILDTSERTSVEGAPSFTFGNRISRLAWTVSWVLLASWTPAPMFSWRRFLLRLFGARLDRTARVYSSARIWLPANLEMGKFACLGKGVIAYTMDRITLESYAIVSQGAHLCAGTHDIDSAHFQLRSRPITIGRYAWVAADAFVGPGVSVGEGAVLGARACAMRDVPAWEVHSGNPARFLRKRNRAIAGSTNPQRSHKRGG